MAGSTRTAAAAGETGSLRGFEGRQVAAFLVQGRDGSSFTTTVSHKPIYTYSCKLQTQYLQFMESSNQQKKDILAQSFRLAIIAKDIVWIIVCRISIKGSHEKAYILHSWQKFYAIAFCDGRDKYLLCRRITNRVQAPFCHYCQVGWGFEIAMLSHLRHKLRAKPKVFTSPVKKLLLNVWYFARSCENKNMTFPRLTILSLVFIGYRFILLKMS